MPNTRYTPIEIIEQYKQVSGSTNIIQTRLYNIWKLMKRRCNRSSCQEFKSYGGRGITICPEWLDFKTFALWAFDSGYTDNLSIDRIDNDGNYEPSNCRWTSSKIQMRNKRNTVFITIEGTTKTMKDWSIQSGVKYTTLKYRFDAGITGKELLKGGDENAMFTQQN